MQQTIRIFIMFRYLSDSFEFYEFKNFANTTKLHPASDLDVGEVFTSTIFNGVIFVGMMLSYECLRRKFPSVYASRQRRENERRRKGGEGHGIGKESSNHTPPAYSKSSDSTDPDLPDIYEDLIPLKWLRPVYSVSWAKVQEVSISNASRHNLTTMKLPYILSFKRRVALMHTFSFDTFECAYTSQVCRHCMAYSYYSRYMHQEIMVLLVGIIFPWPMFRREMSLAYGFRHYLCIFFHFTFYSS